MATTYQTLPFNSGIYYHPVNAVQGLTHSEVARTYGNGDIVQLVRPERYLVLVNAIIGWQQLDSAGPSMTAAVRSNNGTTQQNIITLTAAQLGAAAGGVQMLNVPSAIGYVIPARGYWFEFVVTAGPATAASGQIWWDFNLTSFAYGDVEGTRPPAN